MNHNKATFKGKKFWAGCVNMSDGTIEEVHTYEEAQRNDFHHSLYFSQRTIDGMRNNEMAFFCIGNKGEIEGDWRISIPRRIILRMNEQLGCVV